VLESIFRAEGNSEERRGSDVVKVEEGLYEFDQMAEIYDEAKDKR